LCNSSNKFGNFWTIQSKFDSLNVKRIIIGDSCRGGTEGSAKERSVGMHLKKLTNFYISFK